jgi:hypothetical protein
VRSSIRLVEDLGLDGYVLKSTLYFADDIALMYVYAEQRRGHG